MSMKVLIVHSRSDIVSGAEYAIVDFINVVENISYLHYVPGEGSLAEYLRSNGHTVITTKFARRRRKYPGLYFLSSIIFSVKLKRLKINVILLNTLYSGNRIQLASFLAGIPYAVWLREYGNSFSKWNTKILKNAKYLLAVSNDIGEYYKEHSEKLAVVKDVMSRSSYEKILSNSVARPLSKNTRPTKLLYVGRITEYKRLDLLVEAFCTMNDPSLSLTIVGESTESEVSYKNYILNLIKKAKSKRLNVEYLGHRKTALPIIANHDILVVPSRREPFPRVITEAQILNTLVLASDRGGCPEMIEHNRTGILFPSENLIGLIQSIKFITRDLEKYKFDEIVVSAHKNAVKRSTDFEQTKIFLSILSLVSNE